MCLAKVGQIAYGALSLVSVALISASIFTPGWRQLKSQLLNSVNQNQIPVLNMGLFQSFCSSPNSQDAAYSQQPVANNFQPNTQIQQQISQQIGQQTGQYPQSQYAGNQYGGQQITPQQFAGNLFVTAGSGNPLDYCMQWWQNQPTYEKVVIAAMIIGLLASIASFIWNLTTFCVCCFKGTIQKPLPAISGLATVALAVGVGLYWYKNQANIQQIQSFGQYSSMAFGNIPTTSDVNYSFWMACGAAVSSFANVVVGTLIVCLSDVCL